MYRTSSQFSLGLDELLVDNFAGGGGASTGIEQALGRPVDHAINHNPIAVELHKMNHPATQHFCENVWDVNPRSLVAGRRVGLVWLSPDCKHFSKAKGGKPVDKKIRGLAWVALRWASLQGESKPRGLMLENVEEFVDWGPLVRNELGELYPCKKQKGRTFNSFVNALNRNGFHVEHRELRACDYGAPTIRKRLFLVARSDGEQIVWPEATHGAGLKPYRTAADCIDFSLPCPSIFDRRKPLAEATCRRIAYGIMRYVVNSARPFIVGIDHRGNGNRSAWSIDAPLTTITTENRHALVVAFLAKHYTGVVGSDLRNPIGTVTAVDHHSLITSHLVKLRGDNIGQATDAPLHTVTAGGNHFAEVRAFLIKFYSQGGQWAPLDEPMHTITTKDRIGLVMVHGEPYRIVDIGFRMLQPRELFNAQGFPQNYIIDRLADGRRLTKEQQGLLCGNSVSPHVAKALVAANFGRQLGIGRRIAA